MPQDSELAVSLLYELGEGASEEALKAGSKALGQLALGEQARLLPINVSALVHLCIHLNTQAAIRGLLEE